ncbi:MAG: amidohydrolase family protein [Gemmatimonadota bacterium]
MGALIVPAPARVAVHDVGPSAPPGFLVAGTDAQLGGFELQRELELYVEAGIPAAAVLRIATLDAAAVMGLDNQLGSVTPGKLAVVGCRPLH